MIEVREIQLTHASMPYVIDACAQYADIETTERFDEIFTR